MGMKMAKRPNVHSAQEGNFAEPMWVWRKHWSTIKTTYHVRNVKKNSEVSLHIENTCMMYIHIKPAS
jgi:hypothetical protein